MSDLDVLKNNVVTEMFVDTADQNYLVARWAFHRGMYIDFFWNGVHALEKYFKASLLLNGKSAIANNGGRNFLHNLPLLYESVKEYAGDLFPDLLTRPSQLEAISWWQEETPEDFLARFYEQGEANNRYNIYGHTARHEDLHHFDQMIFQARRVAFDLGESPFLGSPSLPEEHPQTVRDMLIRSKSYMPRGQTSRLYKLLNSTGNDELRDAGLNQNFQFAPENFHPESFTFRTGFSHANSVLYRRVVVPTQRATNSGENDLVASHLGDWVAENIYLPRDVKRQLQDCARQLRRTPTT